jgi:hypothetical protein
VPALAALLALGCTQGTSGVTSGGTNGITYEMSMDRPAVPGGEGHSIEIRMAAGNDTVGTLLVDGVLFGTVRSGEHAVVTDEAIVLVDGEPRTPGGDSGAFPVVDAVVEAACGQCQFGLEGEGCSLAVRIDGKARFVTGTGIDEHGDAHADDGFCNAVRKAHVTGRVEDDRFAVLTLELVPEQDG